MTAPRTAAGRFLFNKVSPFYKNNHGSVTLRLEEWLPAILAIEAEAAEPAPLDVDFALRLQKVADALVPGIRHDFGLEAAARLAAGDKGSDR